MPFRYNNIRRGLRRPDIQSVLSVFRKKIADSQAVRAAVWCGLAALLCVTGLYWRRLEAQASLPEPQTKVLDRYAGNVRKGEILALLLKRHGLSDGVAGGIIQSLSKVFGVSSITPRDRYSLTISTAGVFQRLEITRASTRYYVARTATGYRSGTLDITASAERKSAAGHITGSLWNSLASQGLSAAGIMEFADAFAWNIDFFTETRDGDRFAVVWEETRSCDGYLIGQKVLAAVYDGRETGLKKAFAFNGAFYAENGEELKKMFLRAPLVYRRISSFFTKSRFHPILKIFRPHLGIDYAAPTGTPVSAVANGVVIFSGRKGGFGNYVEIRHNEGFVTAYGHLHKISPKARAGARITQGQVIGYVGSTGLSSGPHLDFRIKQNGKFINFLTMKNRSAGMMDRSKLPAFKAQTAPTLDTINKLLSELKAGKSGK